MERDINSFRAERLAVGWGCEVVDRRGDVRALTWVKGGEKVFYQRWYP